MTDEVLSPSERMAAFRRHMRIEESGLGEYWGTLPFTPDDFQVEALETVALGESVLVCAPTGSGKTVVGEGAAYLALKRHERIFYTTPIKALSNQKYHDFQMLFGNKNVGLLTGDTSVNGDAPIVVMTTEVLRNMIYAGTDLSTLGVVVLDEVHYLSDKFRGPVWEEVLIQLPQSVRIVALSATISNHREFGDWISSVRGSCAVITSTERPVPLYQHMFVGPHLYDLYAKPKRAAASKHPETERLNPDLLDALYTPGGRHGRRGVPSTWVSRARVVEILGQKNLLPVIVFIFSRAGCDAAAAEVAGANLGLTTYEEILEIRRATDEALDMVPPEDHGALQLQAWAHGLESGVASHHAGLLPILKETVEHLFSRGLLKVVYATETLALGINMPARTVVLESLEKWDGSEHVRLGPREYTQLTGRAGRRGIDVEGHAAVLERREITPEEVAALASRRSYPLTSAFRPTYNMAVNLLARAPMDVTRSILESSFAQYQADAAVVQLAQKLRKVEAQAEETHRELNCESGDAAEYFQMREDASRLQKQAATLVRQNRQKSDWNALLGLKMGDVVSYQRGRRRRLAVVIQPASAGFNIPLARVLEEDSKVMKIGPKEAADGIERIGYLFVPKRGVHKPRERQALARELRHGGFKTGGSRRGAPARSDARVSRLLYEADQIEGKLRAHPVHACPDRDTHAVVGHRYVRLLRERDQIAARISSRTARIVSEFDQVCAVLRLLGFLDGDQVTDRGTMLRRVYGERDLVVAECIAEGIWTELDPNEFAAAIAAVVYEPRADASSGSGQVSLPTARLREAWEGTGRVFERILAAESGAGIEVTPEPSADIIGITYMWARGSSLAKVLEKTEMSGGDFVRWMRQIIDMLDQIRRIQDSPLRDSAHAARRRLLRSVVAWTDES